MSWVGYSERTPLPELGSGRSGGNRRPPTKTKVDTGDNGRGRYGDGDSYDKTHSAYVKWHNDTQKQREESRNKQYVLPNRTQLNHNDHYGRHTFTNQQKLW